MTPAIETRATSTEIVERCRAYEGAGLRTFTDTEPLVWDRATGWRVFDADGRSYLDLYGGFAVAAIGHSHPEVVAAVQRQAADLMHCPSAHPSRARAEFLEAMSSIAPPGLDRVLPAITGAMANEIALSIAHTKRPGVVVAFSGGYLGRSLGVVGLAGKARYRDALGVPAGAQFVPFPYPLKMGAGATAVVMEHLDRVAQDAGGAGAVSAVIVEPIQGNGGVVIPPGDFLVKLRDFCDRTGALLIFDEIQSGCGRTGRMWACEHSDVVPDLMTVGKGIGGGMAVAAVLGSTETMTWQPDTYTSTFLTNNLNLAAATAAIGVIRDQHLDDRAARLGPTFIADVQSALRGVRGVAEVRGLGMWMGIELAHQDVAARAAALARSSGVLVGRGGYEDNVVKLSPPLTIDEEDLKEGIGLVVDSVQRACKEEHL